MAKEAEQRSVPRHSSEADQPEKHMVRGYKAGGISRDFMLAKGEPLPQGWADKPPPGEHPHEQEK